jgi:hypothetical protein
MQATTCLLHAITNGNASGRCPGGISRGNASGSMNIIERALLRSHLRERKVGFAPSWFRRDRPGLNLQRSRSAHVPPSCGLDETRRLARSLQTCCLNLVRALEHWDRSVGGACLCLSQRFFQIPCPSLHAPGLRSFPDPIRTVFPA